MPFARTLAYSDGGPVLAQRAPMDSLAMQQVRVLSRLQRDGALGGCGPSLNEERDAQC